MAHTDMAHTEQAPIYTFLDENFAGDTFTQLLGINDFNEIAGYHNQAVNQGFTLTLPNTFTTENFPNSVSTQVVGIENQGETTGFYVDHAGTTHGFINEDNRFETVDAPNTAFTQLLGINNQEQEAGYSSVDPAGLVNQRAFVHNENDGTFNYLTLPTNVNSQATSINDHHDVVGFFMPTATTSDGFLMKDGHLTTLQFPGSTFTQAFGVNNEDDVVGSYLDAKGNTHGFSYDDGHYTTLDVPGATMTVINGINNFDNVVGFFVDAAGNTEGVVGAPLHSILQNDTTPFHHDTHFTQFDHALT
jgi:hypothetical protein